MTNEGEVYFGLIGGDFDPTEMTSFIGIEPTKAKKKSEPIPKMSYWRVSSGKIVGEIVDVYQMCTDLLKIIKPYKEKFILAKEQFHVDAYLEVVLCISTDESISTPAIGFDNEVIQFLYEVGAAIDIDTYRN
jgi:hypothetical protein